MTSCNCELTNVGVVTNASNNEVLRDVEVFEIGNDQFLITMTDSTGSYDYFNFQEGTNCPDTFELLFRKEGFVDTVFRVNNSLSDTARIVMREL